jgi:hypothetical protein
LRLPPLPNSLRASPECFYPGTSRKRCILGNVWPDLLSARETLLGSGSNAKLTQSNLVTKDVGDGLFEISKDKGRAKCKKMYPLFSDTILSTILPQGVEC